jgi:hypothetical protein
MVLPWQMAPQGHMPRRVTISANNPLASRSVDRCSMTREASVPTAASGCHTDCTIIPALQMPYTGGRAVFASRASSPDEGRDAYAK